MSEKPQHATSTRNEKGRHAPSLRQLEKYAVGDDVSRHLLNLGHVNLGLVQTRAEVGSSRYVRHDLTENGLALAKRMAGAAGAEYAGNDAAQDRACCAAEFEQGLNMARDQPCIL